MKSKNLKSKLSISKNVISNLQSNDIKGGCPSGICTGSCICGTGGCPPAPTTGSQCCYK